MIPIDERLRYVLSEEAAIEDFKGGSLLFLCQQQRLIEINASAGKVIRLMNGRRTLSRIISQVAADHDMGEDEVRNDIQELVAGLGEHGGIRPMVKFVENRRQIMYRSSKLLASPDVSLREEEDGALLFKAETNTLQIINHVGLEIWKFIRTHPRTKADIVVHLKNICEDVPVDRVANDVDEFVEVLYEKDFIRKVENENRS
ncbi:MAG TPA: PqqD family peptide modification chaperone [Candidatus Aminicenantes bacterium]|nr:PqqD family peptide modification chaperone [Candidatus Aminicenantes bacterium]